MSSFPYYILLLFFLYQGHSAADENTNGEKYGVKLDEDECSRTMISQFAETMDLISEVNSRLNNTEVYLDQVRKELSMTGVPTDLQIINILSTIREHLPNTGNGIRQNSNSVVLGPRDCSDIRSMGFTASGVYPIYAGGDDKRMPADVYCDFNSFKERWLVFQRRMDGSENFERNYTQYEKGFGNLSGEFWLGLEVLHLLTTNRKYKLRIDLEDFEGEKRFAEYTKFHINSTADFYRLTVGGYSGNAGDSMIYQNGMRFTTHDMDNDAAPFNSAKQFHGGWWYYIGHQANVNGPYLRGPHRSFADGMEWYTWHGFYYSLKKTDMKLMPLED